MNADEKSRQPIPDECKGCMHCETWITREVERHQCLRGHTMQPGCGWMRPATATIDGRKGR